MKKFTNLHTKNYDGTCQFCGGFCENEESKKQWEELENEIYQLKCFILRCEATDKQKRRLSYLLKVEQDHLTYHCNY